MSSLIILENAEQVLAPKAIELEHEVQFFVLLVPNRNSFSSDVKPDGQVKIRFEKSDECVVMGMRPAVVYKEVIS